MRRLWLLGLLLAVAACHKDAPAEGAVRVSISYGSYTPPCVRVSASDSQGHRSETDIPQSGFTAPESRQITVAVFRKPEWDRELSVEVASYDASESAHCSGNVLEHYQESVTPPAGDFATFGVQLKAQDEDHDGYPLKTNEVAGTDCDDTLAGVHPGVAEQCAGSRDFDCDGKSGCEDSDCLDKSCDDHNPCTLNDQCRPGAGSTGECVGTPKVCQPPNFICYTNEAACDTATGECVLTHRPPDTVCNDGSACTSNDQCGLDASCHGTPSVSCTTPPNTLCYESSGTCDATTGSCSYKPKVSTESCDDSNACTQNDRCDGAGTCAGEPLAPCAPNDVCHRSDRNCPSSATCVETVDATKVNSPCTVAALNGVCRPDGVCSTFPYVPSNFNPDDIAEAERGLDVHIDCGSSADPVVFDSSTLSWMLPSSCAPRTLPTAQTPGSAALLPIHNLIIDSGKALKLKGSLPIILAVYGDATLSGDLLADADLDVPGPGGNRTGCGSQKGTTGGFNAQEGTGGGGGGFGTAGAAGGKNNSNTPGGAAGSALASTLVPLVGGCPGGAGGAANSTSNGGAGGGGGGALQLSVAGTLRVDHWVSVSGGGALGGKGTSSNYGGGGGGGSGGGLLLEGYVLQLTAQARLTANGGSGAEGGDSLGRTGSNGVDGSQSSKDPSHCPDVGGNGGPGGDGGAEGGGPGTGGNGPNNAGGGGGGGGMGIIRLRGFGSCAIDSSCDTTDSNGCDLSPKVTATCG
jgi:hypothetical protein